MRVKKILYICHVSTMLGANRSLLNLINGLGDRIDCLVLIPSLGEFSKELDKRQIKYLCVNVPHSSVKQYSRILQTLFYFPRWIKNRVIEIRSLRKIAKAIDIQDFDIVHSNSGVITMGFKLAKRSVKPHVWHLREFQQLDYNIQFLGGQSEFLQLLEDSTEVIAISEVIASHFRCNKNINVIYNGVFSRRREFISPVVQEPYFLFCGALTLEKGIEDAIMAFSKVNSIFPKVKLKIAGEFYSEEVKEKVTCLIKELELGELVVFVGFVNNTCELMSKSIALLMCSHFEALGRVTLEAMFNGCLVIGRESAGTKELLMDGITGFLYKDKSELESKMLAVLSEHINADEIRKSAFEYVNTFFTEERYAEEVYKIYNKIGQAN